MIKQILVAAILTSACALIGQMLPRVETFGFHPEPTLIVTVMLKASVECRGADYIKNGVKYSDRSFHEAFIDGDIEFANQGKTSVLLFKKFNPSYTQRIALSENDLNSGNFVGGYDADRVLGPENIQQVSIADFALIKPRKNYDVPFHAKVYLVGEHDRANLSPGEYWVQLGIDARPDAFYFNVNEEKQFIKRWHIQAQILEFVPTRPFKIKFTFDRSLRECDR